MNSVQTRIPTSASPRASREQVIEAIRRLLLGGPRQPYGAADAGKKALRDRIARGDNRMPEHLLTLFEGRPDEAMTLGRVLAKHSLPMLDVIPFPQALAEETAAQAEADVQQIAALRATAERRPLLVHERMQLRVAIRRHMRTLEAMERSLDAEEMSA